MLLVPSSSRHEWALSHLRLPSPASAAILTCFPFSRTVPLSLSDPPADRTLHKGTPPSAYSAYRVQACPSPAMDVLLTTFHFMPSTSSGPPAASAHAITLLASPPSPHACTLAYLARTHTSAPTSAPSAETSHMTVIASTSLITSKRSEPKLLKQSLTSHHRAEPQSSANMQ